MSSTFSVSSWKTAMAPASAGVPSVSTHTVPTPVSSTRLLALKGTIGRMKALSDQFHQCVTQAEEQMAAIETAKKRGALDSNPGTGGGATPAKVARTGGGATPAKVARNLSYTPTKGATFLTPVLAFKWVCHVKCLHMYGCTQRCHSSFIQRNSYIFNTCLNKKKTP